MLDVAVKGSVKFSVQSQVKGIKYESSAREPLIKDVKGEKSCLLDGGKGTIHVKSRGDSVGMERQDSWCME